MQARDFVFWLQGLLEVGKVETLDAEQVSIIKTHLDLVFRHDDGIKQEEMAHEAPAAPGKPLDIQFVRQVLSQKPSVERNPRATFLC